MGYRTAASASPGGAASSERFTRACASGGEAPHIRCGLDGREHGPSSARLRRTGPAPRHVRHTRGRGEAALRRPIPSRPPGRRSARQDTEGRLFRSANAPGDRAPSGVRPSHRNCFAQPCPPFSLLIGPVRFPYPPDRPSQDMVHRVRAALHQTAAGADEAACAQDLDLHRRAIVTAHAGLSWRRRSSELDLRGRPRHVRISWPRDGPGCRSSGASQPGCAGAACGARFVQAGARKRSRLSIMPTQPVRTISGRPTRMFSSSRILETGNVVIAARKPLFLSTTKTSARPSLIR